MFPLLILHNRFMSDSPMPSDTTPSAITASTCSASALRNAANKIMRVVGIALAHAVQLALAVIRGVAVQANNGGLATVLCKLVIPRADILCHAVVVCGKNTSASGI